MKRYVLGVLSWLITLNVLLFSLFVIPTTESDFPVRMTLLIVSGLSVLPMAGIIWKKGLPETLALCLCFGYFSFRLLPYAIIPYACALGKACI